METILTQPSPVVLLLLLEIARLQPLTRVQGFDIQKMCEISWKNQNQLSFWLSFYYYCRFWSIGAYVYKNSS